MKWVMSVSLGDPSRDYCVEAKIAGERVVLERRGTGGSVRLACDLIRRHDGLVSAFGLGGANFHYIAGAAEFRMPEGWTIRAAAKKSPVADGSRVKRFIEPLIIDLLAENGVQFRRRKAAISSALDRWHLAEALETAGCEVAVLDAALALRLPVVFPGTRTFGIAARVTMPALSRLPVGWLYPRRIDYTPGASAGGLTERLAARLAEGAMSAADVIAGDSYLMWKHMPGRLDGKTVIVSTATPGEVGELKARGAAVVASTSPSLSGRSLGANVIEAMILAFDGRPPEEIPPACYREWWNRLGLRFRIEGHQ
ncbi:MAG: quinate 5-dehydrogenase [Ignavibacteriales bacterium]